ncbi:dermonecrotic toxin domain-containing protein [Pseudomonas sp. NPDC089408]|uniref:dermonecrotic toxin domain-containing protein n=1 Tax=Pseudomonas sp. NPDC089408 TaxID=3364465 RepID=UPI0037FAECDC
MNPIKEKVLRGLQAVDAGRPLVGLVDHILSDYPDLYALATQHAAQIVRKHTGKAMDPRFVWWHQFNTSSTSPRTFTGWEHSGPPQKSMVLTELVLERFDLYFQDASDELDQRGGFYLQGPHGMAFDERNEVRMLGSQVQKDLWALDFATLYREHVERFWQGNGKHFCALAKVNLLGQGATAWREGRITRLDWQRLYPLVCANLAEGQVPTLEQLQQAGNSPLTINRYVFVEGDRGSLFSLHAQDGRVLAYMPWAEEVLRGFDSELAMASWVRAQLQVPSNLEAFVVGAHSNPRDRSINQLLRVHLQGIADSRSDQATVVALSLFKRALNGDLFFWLADQAIAEMRRNGQLLQDNARLRKAMYSGYLSAFLNVFGGLAPLGWPISLMLLGATIDKVALDVDEALHANTEQERRAALRTAMIESIFAGLNMVDVAFSTSFASLAYEAPPHEARANLEDWHPVQTPTLAVEGQESNALHPGEIAQSGRLRGIRVNPDGSCWISLNGLVYRVRYSHELGVWLVVPADNPFAFGELQPVRLNAAGEWELLAPPRLLGGAPLEGMPNNATPFWDTYTSIDDVQSTRLAEQALERQKALLEKWPIAELVSGQVPDVDGRGLDCVKVGGRPYYSYRYGDEYFNSLIEWYTSNESTVNDVFRVGRYQYGDEDSYIDDLADSLELLPKSNEATLYRGGHGSRGTSGEYYRSGHLRVGDVLVNTDLTSFTENPYKVAEFACLPFSQAPGGLPGLFDDSSVVFELAAGRYRGATPISAFSIYWKEGETLFLPGNYFRIEGLEQVSGEHYRFIKVTLGQTGKPAAGPVYDLRTGLPFDEAAYRAQFRTPGLAERFFAS